MLFHFAVLLWTVIFSAGLFVIASRPVLPSWDWYLYSIIPLAIVVVIAAKRIAKRYLAAFVPLVFAITAPVLLSLIDSVDERKIFAVATGFALYLALLAGYRLRLSPLDMTARAMLSSAAVAGLFLFFAGAYGFYLNFTFPLWGLMLLFALATFLISFQTLVAFTRHERRRALIYAITHAIVMGELIWGMSFWPVGYLTTAAVAIILYYLLWDIARDALQNELSLRRTLIRIASSLALAAFVMLSSPWRMVG
jgi:hypothetical protein